MEKRVRVPIWERRSFIRSITASPLPRRSIWILVLLGICLVASRWPAHYPRPDILLGAGLVAMAMLGGIVSAHAPETFTAKLLYGTAFVMLAVIGVRLVIQQSNEAAEADRQFKQTLAGIASSTAEAQRIQALNTKLQERLLSQSGTIASLSKQTVGQLTGGKTFCYFTVSPNTGSGSPVSYPLIVWVRGQYPMQHVVSTIQTVSPAGDPQSVMRQLQSMRTLPIGDGTLLPGVHLLDFRLDQGQYSIQTWSVSGGPINEVIDLRIVDGRLDQNVEVWGGGKRLYKLGSKDLGFAKPEK